MRIVIFGIDNFMGEKIAQYALSTRKFQISGVIEHIASYTDSIVGIEIIEGDISNALNIKKALRGKDLVISTLGIAETQQRSETYMYPKIMDTLLNTMEMRGIRRVLYLANDSILQADEEKQTFLLPNFEEKQLPIAMAYQRIYQKLKQGKFDWTLVGTPKITQHELTKKYRVKLDYLPKEGTEISAYDLAHFMVEEIKNGFFVHQRVGIAY